MTIQMFYETGKCSPVITMRLTPDRLGRRRCQLLGCRKGAEGEDDGGRECLHIAVNKRETPGGM